MIEEKSSSSVKKAPCSLDQRFNHMKPRVMTIGTQVHPTVFFSQCAGLPESIKGSGPTTLLWPHRSLRKYILERWERWSQVKSVKEAREEIRERGACVHAGGTGKEVGEARVYIR